MARCCDKSTQIFICYNITLPNHISKNFIEGITKDSKDKTAIATNDRVWIASKSSLYDLKIFFSNKRLISLMVDGGLVRKALMMRFLRTSCTFYAHHTVDADAEDGVFRKIKFNEKQLHAVGKH